MPPLRSLTAASLLFLTAACAAPMTNSDGSPAFLEELPEGLAEIAAPGQNLQRVLILPEDACYWYEHVGPVETTLLPLRAQSGRPVCSQPRT